jgi:heptosyltransferase-2
MDSETLKTDCRHFRSDRPCAPHKLRGKVCATCDEYDPTASRVLIVKLGAMGDVLRTTCILRGVKERFGAPVVWVTRAESVDLLRGNPFIEDIWVADDSLPSKLEHEPFRAVINLDAERGSAAICAMARSQNKIGFSLDANGAVLPTNEAARRWFEMGINDELKRANRRTYQHHVADIIGIPAKDNELVFALTEREKQQAMAFAKKSLPKQRGKVIGFNTGGAERWKRKQWTFDGFKKLARRILEETENSIILYGGGSEVAFNNRLKLKLRSDRVLNVNTRKSVRDFAAMLSLCDVLVTGDTLGLHLAAALGKPLVVIFGPTSAAEIEIYGRGCKLTPTMPCKSFYKPVCEASPCCVETITPDVVFEAVQKATVQNFPKLEGRAPSRPNPRNGHDGACPSTSRELGDF